MQDITLGRLNGRFVVSWWENGKRRRYRLAARERKAAEAEALDVYRNAVLRDDKGAAPTVTDLWQAYRNEKQGQRVAEAMRHEWKAMAPHFAGLKPEQVSIDICRAYTAARRQKGKHDGTIWTELGHLRTVFTWAHKRRMIDHAPSIERPPKPAPKDRWLTEDEISTFMAAPAAPHIDLACILMLSTAARVSAVLDLKWDRVDFEAGVINLRVAGSGPRKGRAIVPMNAWNRAALQTARQLALSDYVIEWAGKPVKSIKTGFGLKVKAAGLEKVSPHVLRHTAAVHLAKDGAPMSRIAQYLGHTSTAVTERVYARFAPDHLRTEAQILDFGKLRKVSG